MRTFGWSLTKWTHSFNASIAMPPQCEINFSVERAALELPLGSSWNVLRQYLLLHGCPATEVDGDKADLQNQLYEERIKIIQSAGFITTRSIETLLPVKNFVAADQLEAFPIKVLLVTPMQPNKAFDLTSVSSRPPIIE
jgi:hypothetical protein